MLGFVSFPYGTHLTVLSTLGIFHLLLPLKAWIGGMLESSVGAGICLELAAMPNMAYPSDLFPTSRPTMRASAVAYSV